MILWGDHPSKEIQWCYRVWKSETQTTLHWIKKPWCIRSRSLGVIDEITSPIRIQMLPSCYKHGFNSITIQIMIITNIKMPITAIQYENPSLQRRSRKIWLTINNIKQCFTTLGRVILAGVSYKRKRTYIYIYIYIIFCEVGHIQHLWGRRPALM